MTDFPVVLICLITFHGVASNRIPQKALSNKREVCESATINDVVRTQVQAILTYLCI